MKFENKGKWLKQIQESSLADLETIAKKIVDTNIKLSKEQVAKRLKEVCSPSTSEADIVEVAKKYATESTQKNEGSIAKNNFLNWKKLPQVKSAIQKADKAVFEKLMDEFTKTTLSKEEFPMVDIKDGHLVFAETDDIITIDSIANEWFADKHFFESTQKNEASLSKDDINFENIGCGFEVIVNWENRRYELSCSGYSNNIGKKLNFVNDKLTGSEDSYREAQVYAIKIAKDLKAAADKLDKEVAAIFAKYGFKKN